MSWSDLAANPLSVSTLILFVLYVVWTERKGILALFSRRQALAERDAQGDIAFEEQVRGRLLENGDYSRTLTDRIMGMLETERTERRSLSAQMLSRADAVQEVSAQAVEVMHDFADISRMQCDRMDGVTERIVTILERQEQMQSAIWFVLAKYGLHNPQADINEMVKTLGLEETK